MKTGAVISGCKTYRYSLWREWDHQKPRLGWIMLNPSIADAETDDPTIRRCVERARALDCGGIEVRNLWQLSL